MRTAAKTVIAAIAASAIAAPFTEPLNWWIGRFLDQHPDAMSSVWARGWGVVEQAVSYIPGGLLPGFAAGAGFAFLMLRGWKPWRSSPHEPALAAHRGSE